MARKTRKGATHQAVEAPLPTVSPAVVDAVVDLLMTQEGMFRPPEKSAALLALIVELHKQRRPFPTRATVAKALDCSVFTVDAALSTRIDEGYLSMAVETESGNVQQRHSTIRKRYYIPSQQLMSAVAGAKRRAGSAD